ncbi:hypothetical protein ON010_g15815 [Phytophthora cinnamomi]|nr:hypothetical protein ON010_g15815 [Phytophthora cinnamomi]
MEVDGANYEDEATTEKTNGEKETVAPIKVVIPSRTEPYRDEPNAEKECAETPSRENPKRDEPKAEQRGETPSRKEPKRGEREPQAGEEPPPSGDLERDENEPRTIYEDFGMKVNRNTIDTERDEPSCVDPNGNDNLENQETNEEQLQELPLTALSGLLNIPEVKLARNRESSPGVLSTPEYRPRWYQETLAAYEETKRANRDFRGALKAEAAVTAVCSVLDGGPDARFVRRGANLDIVQTPGTRKVRPSIDIDEAAVEQTSR